jgi:hypothetical protein
MCHICDGGTPIQEHQKTRDRIAYGQWSLTGVEGRFPWAYTIGLADHGHPELVTLGCLHHGPQLLNIVAGQVMAGRLSPAAGQHLEHDGQRIIVERIDPRHIRNGLMAVWFDYHEWAGVDVEHRALQLRFDSDEPNPPLMARSLSGWRDPLHLQPDRTRTARDRRRRRAS